MSCRGTPWYQQHLTAGKGRWLLGCGCVHVAIADSQPPNTCSPCRLTGLSSTYRTSHVDVRSVWRLDFSHGCCTPHTHHTHLAHTNICTPPTHTPHHRPPTKNAERIERYKLMIATATGVVKDVYQGKETRFKVTGLKPNTEYILCVKAIYDDGSFLWSESKPYMTRT